MSQAPDPDDPDDPDDDCVLEAAQTPGAAVITSGGGQFESVRRYGA